MGPTVRWPRKNERPNSRRDTTKWCDFHADIGHTTEDCIALRKEVAHLLKKGYLQDLISKSGTKKEQEAKPESSKPTKAPPVELEVMFINGGSEVCGLTYSAAKKINRENKMQPPSSLPQVSCPITFDESDLQGILPGHHSSLVIRMQIGTARVRRILVDGGSSVNIILMETLSGMGIKEDQIIKKSDVLVGFSGETKHTLGMIELPTYVEGICSYEKFSVMTNLSSYNVILGRPWLHNVNAVPSTYHQCVKIPSAWGVVTIKGEAQIAQDCYAASLKPGNTNA